jgi:hypothetical protein
MTDIKTSPQINISVAIDTSNDNYQYFDENGQPCKGGATVKVPNTLLVYSLIANNNTLEFQLPVITAGNTDDITVSISSCKQTLTIIDSDLTNEDICLRLIVKELASDQTFESSDPQIKNVPR